MLMANKLQKWVDNQLITQEQKEQIIYFEKQGGNNLFWRSAFIIAGLLIGLGIILIVASNWNIVPVWLKLFVDFSISLSFVCGAYWTIITNKKKLKELFLILSFLMVGATIGLIGQIFNLNGGWESFSSSWALLGLPFVFYSRSLFFNIIWVYFFNNLTIYIWGREWLRKLLDLLNNDFIISVSIVIILSLFSYGMKKIDDKTNKYTLIFKAFALMALWSAYFGVLVSSLNWGVASLSSCIVVFGFLVYRILLALKTQNVLSFRRNITLAELYIFAIFATRYGDLLSSGIGFIVAGLIILLFIYILKKTSNYIKNMEVFK